jgi:L-alanine-DL-glutamate epimerase-like enolase superfamily enzyme
MAFQRVPIDRVTASVYSVPTDAPEEDGTFAWDRTSIVLAEVHAGNRMGFGYTYTSDAAASIIRNLLASVLLGEDALDTARHWKAMLGMVRNLGSRGVCASAIAALDVALWDLKARLLDVPLVRLFGSMREAVPIYGSGGFTSYDESRLVEQLGRWAHEDGCQWVKMKIGAQPERDLQRIRAARGAIGTADLMIDANGAFDRKKALLFADKAACIGVVWFEEPVSSDDLDGLRLLRDKAFGGIEIAAGEYGYDLFYFKRMMDQGAVDVLQADATRCCGYTGFLAAAWLADAQPLPLSAHTAPALHLPVCCAAPRLRHIEWFHDHVRIESMFFDGAPKPIKGMIRPDLSRPGHGLEFKRADAERFAI